MIADCFAIRLAGAFERRFGVRALELAEMRRSRALAGGSHMKADLFGAITTILRDDGSVFSRYRS